MKVCIGLSGGVDSSVAALLLKKAGYDVFALFMQNWHDTEGTLHGDCEWEEDRFVAEMVARKIGIPFYFVDLSEEYRKRVVDYMFDEYSKGRTPNPDVLCNREIKFDAFLKCAERLGADYVATGHYCRKDEIKGPDGKPVYRIFAGTDPNKDQSYFLCQLTQAQLSKALFPIGDILKPEVRRIAAEADLPSADKKDSQGICFVGKVDLPVFLQQKLKPAEGDVVEIFDSYYGNDSHYRYVAETLRSLAAEGRSDDVRLITDYISEDKCHDSSQESPVEPVFSPEKVAALSDGQLDRFVENLFKVNNAVYAGNSADYLKSPEKLSLSEEGYLNVQSANAACGKTDISVDDMFAVNPNTYRPMDFTHRQKAEMSPEQLTALYLQQTPTTFSVQPPPPPPPPKDKEEKISQTFMNPLSQEQAKAMGLPPLDQKNTISATMSPVSKEYAQKIGMPDLPKEAGTIRMNPLSQEQAKAMGLPPLDQKSPISATMSPVSKEYAQKIGMPDLPKEAMPLPALGKTTNLEGLSLHGKLMKIQKTLDENKENSAVNVAEIIQNRVKNSRS